MIQSGGYFHYADQQRPDGYFRTDITENAERAQNQVFVLPHAGFAVMAVFGYFLGDFTRVGQFDHFHEYGQQYQNAGQAQIRYLHRRNLFGLAGGLSGIGQNQHRTNHGATVVPSELNACTSVSVEDSLPGLDNRVT